MWDNTITQLYFPPWSVESLNRIVIFSAFSKIKNKKGKDLLIHQHQT